MVISRKIWLGRRHGRRSIGRNALTNPPLRRWNRPWTDVQLLQGGRQGGHLLQLLPAGATAGVLHRRALGEAPRRQGRGAGCGTTGREGVPRDGAHGKTVGGTVHSGGGGCGVRPVLTSHIHVRGHIQVFCFRPWGVPPLCPPRPAHDHLEAGTGIWKPPYFIGFSLGLGLGLFHRFS